MGCINSQSHLINPISDFEVFNIYGIYCCNKQEFYSQLMSTTVMMTNSYSKTFETYLFENYSKFLHSSIMTSSMELAHLAPYFLILVFLCLGLEGLDLVGIKTIEFLLMLIIHHNLARRSEFQVCITISWTGTDWQ